MILGREFKTELLNIGCGLRDLHTLFFVTAWPKIESGEVVPHDTTFNDNSGKEHKDTVLAMPGVEVDNAVEIEGKDFFEQYYEEVRKGIIRGRVWVVPGDPPRYVHSNHVTTNDFFNHVDKAEALQILKEQKRALNE